MEELTAAGALVATEVIKSLAKDMASFVKEKVSTYFTNTTNKELIDSEWAFEDYLTRMYDKYSVSKSILYTNTARKLESFYVPMDLAPLEELRRVSLYGAGVSRATTIPSDDICDVLSRYNNIIIVGTGGMGKTMALKYFCMNAIENAYRIPVFISLRWFNDIEKSDDLIEKLRKH